MKRIENNNLSKAVVMAIVTVFIGSSLLPVVGSQSKSIENQKTTYLDSGTRLITANTNQYCDDINSFDNHKQQDDYHIYVQSPMSKSIGDWWDSSWNYRRSIIINHNLVDTNLTNFPFLINFTLDKTKVKTNGEDIVFINNDGSTQFHHEIESYDDSTGNLIAWVNIEDISSIEDTFFYF